MATLGIDALAIRDAAPAIRSYCLLFSGASWTAEMVAAFAAKRLEGDLLPAIQVALMFFTMCGISMTLAASAIAARRTAVRVLLVAAAALPLAFVVYSLLQLPA